MKNIRLYTKNFCPYCSAAKTLLTNKKIPFEEFNLSQDLEQLKELMEKNQFTTVPLIFIGDEFIGGYTEMMALEASANLDFKIR